MLQWPIFLNFSCSWHLIWIMFSVQWKQKWNHQWTWNDGGTFMNFRFSIISVGGHTIESYWIPSQKNYRSRTENVTERIRISKSRSNDLADIGQGQRSSHATHLLMLVIICTKYGKNPSRTVDATKRTRFSRSRPNDLENIGQRSKVITCDTPSDANDDLCQIWKECKQNCRFFFSRWKQKNKKNLRKIEILEYCFELNTRHTL